MTAPARALSVGFASWGEPARKVPQKSRSKVLPQSFGSTAFVSPAFRDWFPEALSRFLQSSFRNAEEVSVVYGVRYQTALNWWNGTHRASGDVVAQVFMGFEGARAWFMAEWHRHCEVAA